MPTTAYQKKTACSFLPSSTSLPPSCSDCRHIPAEALWTVPLRHFYYRRLDRVVLYLLFQPRQLLFAGCQAKDPSPAQAASPV